MFMFILYTTFKVWWIFISFFIGVPFFGIKLAVAWTLML